MRLYRWVAWHAWCIACMAVGLGLLTGNPNWPLNAPIGALAGAAYGLASWPLVRPARRGKDRP